MGARVEHTDNEVEAGIIVRDDGEHGGLYFADAPQVHLVRLCDARQRGQVELLKPGYQRDLNGF